MIRSGWRADARWKVPALFCNDWMCITLASALRERYGRAVLHTAYGAPACAWAGGRPPLVTGRLEPDEVRELFDAYRRCGMGVSLTLSRMRIDAESLADPYCNMLLDLLEECGGSAIVGDDALASYIRATRPGVRLVATIARANVAWAEGFPGVSGELEFYERMLELYDEAVVRCEAAWDEGLLRGLEPVAGRVQLLVNQPCPPGCRLYGRHTALGEAALAQGEKMPPCMNPARGKADMAYPEELLAALVGRGFTHLKIQGRDEEPYRLAQEMLGYVTGSRDPARVLEPSAVLALKMMSLPGTDRLMRTRVPLSARPS